MKQLRKKQFIIPIHPVAWKRAGRNKAMYYDTQVQEKIACGLYMAKQLGNEPLFLTGPLLLTVTFYVRIPFSLSKTVQENDYCFKKPDCSNFLKFVEDAMKDVLIKDDALFAGTIAFKRYSKTPRLEMTIEELPRC